MSPIQVRLRLIAPLLLGMILTSCAVVGKEVKVGSTARTGSPPRSMEAFVESSPLIVEAHLVSTQYVGESTGFSEDGTTFYIVPPTSPAIDPPFTLSITEMVFQVDAVYRNTTGVTVAEGDRLSLPGVAIIVGPCPTNVMPDWGAKASDEPGSSWLCGMEFMSQRDGGGAWWNFAHYSIAGCFDLSGDTVVNRQCPSQSPAWGSTITPEQFRSDLIAAIGGQ